MNNRLFTTKDIDTILEGYKSGKKITRKNNVLYRGNEGTRDSGIIMALSQKEMIEYSKCYQSPLYFIESYCKIRLGDGSIGSIVLRDYQKKLIENFSNNRFNIYMLSRQVGGSNIMALVYLWYMVFSIDKTILLFANKGDTAVEHLNKIKVAYLSLPFFLKPGIKLWNQKSLKFENGCRIVGTTPYKYSVPGFGVDVLTFLDFAHIPPNILEPLFTTLYPSVAARVDSRINIISSPNGMNLFMKLVQGSERPEGDPLKNNFITSRVYWWQVPGRDLDWRNRTVSDIGSEAAFRQEYELSFSPREV